MTSMAKVLIIGAIRGIGFETVRAALVADHSVRALARSAGATSLSKAMFDAGLVFLATREKPRPRWTHVTGASQPKDESQGTTHRGDNSRKTVRVTRDKRRPWGFIFAVLN
jgi:NAD(P)-dependent dehydrogenase (short-subunit alcohol dehydrogenase family)